MRDTTYPAKLCCGCRLHVYRQGGATGEWEVWLNTETADFDGLCVAVGSTYAAAVAEAVTVFERAAELLQGPPWFPEEDTP